MELEQYKDFVTVKSTGLDIKHGMPIESWLEIGLKLKRINSGIQFWLGDWLKYGEANYGDMYTQALDETDYTNGSLRNIVYVCNQIEMSRRRDNVSFSAHAEVASLEPELQDKALDGIQENNLSFRDARSFVKKIKRQALAIEPELTLPNIHNIDFRKLELADESVDCIVTDPPYPEEYLDLYGDLGRLAERILKPSGFLVMYCGHIHLDKVFEQMNCGLSYYWTYCLDQPGGTQLVMPRNLMASWKPILIYQKPPFKKLEFAAPDKVISESASKDGHEWQQSASGVKGLIERFSHEGDTLFEPFMGAGTFVLEAQRLKRNIIATEVDTETYNIAMGQINGVSR
jgi:hypothetical protein